MQIVGLVGVAGSGKTYNRDLLIAQGFVPLDFKDELISMVEDLVGFSIRNDYELFKECVIGISHQIARLQPGDKHMREWLMAKSGTMLLAHPDLMTGRKMLQNLGTEVMRKRDPDYWVKAFCAKAAAALKSGKSVVVADCRFENEVRAIQELAKQTGAQAVFKFCDFRSARYNAGMKHESERLAQELLAAGYKDGDIISESDL